MSRSHFYRPVTDSEGNIVPNTKITIYERGSTALVAQKLYSSPSGSTTLTNPFVSSSGIIDFYLDSPQSVKIGMSVARQGGNEITVDDLDVLPPANEYVRAEKSFEIMNAGGPGQFLQSGLVAGQAYWVDAADIVNSRPTALANIKSYDFSSSYLDDLELVDSSGTARAAIFNDVTNEPKPQGYTFIQELAFPALTTARLNVPVATWPERGYVLFCYKVVTKTGREAATLRVSVDNETFGVETPTSLELANGWRVGYLTGISAGSHALRFEHRPGLDPASDVRLGPIYLRSGDNIPEHSHGGAGANSTRLGPDSVADVEAVTVVGAGAKGTGVNATVFGAFSQASTDGVAIGRGVTVASGSVGLGQGAGGTLLASEWVAVGRQARAGADSAVALGARSRAQGPRSLAIGPQASAGASGEAVALGGSTSAGGYRSVALGQGARADHDYSVAIGPGVVTTAAHEARIGDAETTTVLPGSFRHVGASAVYGSASSKVGFFGNPGIAKPVVQGSRGNNAVLKQLLDTLSAMGLITDRSTA